MDEPQQPLTSKPSRARLAVRRGGALLVLLAVIGGAVWLGASALGGGSEDPPPPPTTTAAPALKTLRIIFPEGYTRREMGDRVAAVRKIAIAKRKVVPRLTQQAYLASTRRIVPPKGFRKDVPRGNAEGFLFPALYEFTQKTTANQLVRKQLSAFRAAWAQVDLRKARRKNPTPYDVLIIASMVEKETVAPRERRLVAAVIWNRLRARMPLGIDATIRYGLNVPGTEPLRQSQLSSPSPYNTRNRTGLPPTPIANPGLASMQAAANPAPVDYLFFVRKPDRVHHFFTSSEAEFYAKACEYGFGCR
jgi:peptidoglycan lytic transglycosylase G